jgi:SRSO17 transposase
MVSGSLPDKECVTIAGNHTSRSYHTVKPSPDLSPEIIFGKRQRLRYYQITKGDTRDPTGDNSWYIMTNLEGKIQLKVAQLYSLRNWIEYGFKQVKNELGWADYRLTDYPSIERWWSIIFSAYLLVIPFF